MKTIRMQFNVRQETATELQALAENRSEEGYIVKEDFLRFFNLPGLLGGKYFEVE